MKHLISAACAAALLCAASASAAAAKKLPSATSVTVTAAAPEPGDHERTARENGAKGLSTAGDEPVYIVKVYLDPVPVPGAEAFHLWVGDKRIKEYGSFDKGVFFKLYHPQDADDLAGKPLKASRGKQAASEMGKSFPVTQAAAAQAQTATKRPSVADVLAGKDGQ